MHCWLCNVISLQCHTVCDGEKTIHMRVLKLSSQIKAHWFWQWKFLRAISDNNWWLMPSSQDCNCAKVREYLHKVTHIKKFCKVKLFSAENNQCPSGTLIYLPKRCYSNYLYWTFHWACAAWAVFSACERCAKNGTHSAGDINLPVNSRSCYPDNSLPGPIILCDCVRLVTQAPSSQS